VHLNLAKRVSDKERGAILYPIEAKVEGLDIEQGLLGAECETRYSPVRGGPKEMIG
jgi:hypothetical protein